jgi:CBS domain containing-hemolysin-like protein
MSDLTAVVLALALLLGNALFVGAEFALVSARRTQIEPRAEEGGRLARMTLRAMENVSLIRSWTRWPSLRDCCTRSRSRWP